MAKLTNGILGGISGTIGNVVGGNWNGIDYIRSKPSSVKNPRTQAQVKHRAKFKFLSVYLQSIKGLVNVGLRKVAKKMSPSNKALSINLNEAVTGEYPDYEINLSALKFSIGSLQPLGAIQLTSAESGKLSLSWSDNSGSQLAASTDRLMMLVFNPATGESYYNTDVAQRDAESAEIDLPGTFHGVEIQVQVALISDDRNKVSDNQYAGIVTISE